MTRSSPAESTAEVLWPRRDGVEGARGVQVAAPHLQLHLAQSGSVVAVRELQDYRPQAQVPAP